MTYDGVYLTVYHGYQDPINALRIALKMIALSDCVHSWSICGQNLCSQWDHACCGKLLGSGRVCSYTTLLRRNCNWVTRRNLQKTKCTYLFTKTLKACMLVYSAFSLKNMMSLMNVMKQTGCSKIA